MAHGTEISLYVAAKTGNSAADLWRRLGLPSFVVLDRPGLDLVRVVERVEDDDAPAPRAP